MGTVHAHLRRDQRDGGGVSGAAGPERGEGASRRQRDRQCRDLPASPVGNENRRAFVSEVVARGRGGVRPLCKVTQNEIAAGSGYL